MCVTWHPLELVLTSAQKGLYVFVFPQGRVVQVIHQCIHRILYRTTVRIKHNTLDMLTVVRMSIMTKFHLQKGGAADKVWGPLCGQPNNLTQQQQKIQIKEVWRSFVSTLMLGEKEKERRKSRKNEERKEGKSVSVLAAELRLGCGC